MPSRSTSLITLIGLCLALSAAGLQAQTAPTPASTQAPLTTIAALDVPRYMGRWYVIANIPYFGERGNVGSYAEWSLRPDGRIDDAYVYRPGSFDAPFKRMQFVDSVVEGSGGGEWRVRLFWPIYVSQLTLYVRPLTKRMERKKIRSQDFLHLATPMLLSQLVIEIPKTQIAQEVTPWINKLRMLRVCFTLMFGGAKSYILTL